MPELLAESADHEERVVDRERQADHAGEVRDEDAHVGDAGEQADDREPGRQGKPHDQERQDRADERAEHREQDDERDRQADDLGLDQVALDLLVELVVELRDAGDLDTDPRWRLDELGQLRRIVDSPFVGLAQGEDAQRSSPVPAEQLGDRRIAVRGDAGHERLGLQRCQALGDQLLEGGRGGIAVRIGEQDDHRRRLLSEPLGKQGLGALLLRPIDHPPALDERSARQSRPMSTTATATNSPMTGMTRRNR